MPARFSEDGRGLLFPTANSKTDKKVDVTIETGRTEDLKRWPKLFQHQKIQNWISTVSEETASRVTSVSVKSIDMVADELSSLTLGIEMRTGSSAISQTVTIRGSSACVLIMLRNSQTQRDMVLFSVTDRLAVGEPNYMEIQRVEIDQEGNATGPTAADLQERFGIQIMASDMVNLTQLSFGEQTRGISTIPDSSDERVQLYLFRKNYTQEELDKLQEQLTVEKGGDAARNRYQLVHLGDAWRSTSDTKSMAALFLLHELRYHSLMPRYRPAVRAGDSDAVDKVKPVFRKVEDLAPECTGVNIRIKTVRVLGEESVMTDRRRVTLMQVGDETGMINVHVQRPAFEPISKPNVALTIRNGYIDMFSHHMVLVVGRWGKITEEAEDAEGFDFSVDTNMDASATEYELVVLRPNGNVDGNNEPSSDGVKLMRARGGRGRGRGRRGRMIRGRGRRG